MVHAPPLPPATPRRTHLPPAVLLSVAALLSLLTKTAKKLRPRHNNNNKTHNKPNYYYDHYESSSSIDEPVKTPTTPRTPRTPLARRPKELFTHVSNKAINFVHGRKKGGGGAGEEGGFGDGGVWQRTILMGDKCQPLDFSGVIYYDENGRKLNQLPIRSPRASPLPGYLARRDFLGINQSN